MSKNKIPISEKLNAVLTYLEGKESQRSISKRLGIAPSSFQKWVIKYQSMGESAFYINKNKHYSRELKENAVCEYLSGIDSQIGICKKYGIHSTSQLQRWIMKYNGHERLKSSGTGGKNIMTKGRSTTFEERVEIASFCISHNHNYAETAEKYKVSYQQARNYTIKYEAYGISGLTDNRGKRKSEDELTEVEKLRAELKLEKAKRQRAEMEASFLKKLNEIERRRG